MAQHSDQVAHSDTGSPPISDLQRADGQDPGNITPSLPLLDHVDSSNEARTIEHDEQRAEKDARIARDKSKAKTNREPSQVLPKRKVSTSHDKQSKKPKTDLSAQIVETGKMESTQALPTKPDESDSNDMPAAILRSAEHDQRLFSEDSMPGEAKVDATAKQNLSDSDTKQAKMPKAVLDVPIVEHSEQWVEAGDDFVFDKTKIIIQLGDSVFMATTEKKIQPKLGVLNLGASDPVRISPEHFCPEFKQGLTRASVPLPEDIYVKKPSLLSWDPEDHGGIAALVLQEAEICEILKDHPHPNIAQYHGCLVENGRITGLCFTNYRSNLEETLAKWKDITEAEKLALSNAIENGIHHIHRVGLAHNDINPSNIMMDGEKPVIIDFDSARPIGEKLGEKAGTFEWELEGAEFSEPENDIFGLRKIQELTLQIESQAV